MNSTREIFVRRNIKTKVKVYRDVESKYNISIDTVAQTNESILLAGMNGKTSYYNVFEKNNAEYLHKQLKPLLIFLRLLGCFPVHFSKSDVPRYRAFSPAFIYSVCLYVVVNIMSLLSARNSILYVFKKNDNVNDTVLHIVMILMLVICTCVPVISWIDTPKFVQYLHKWEQFQMMFVMVTGDHLILNTRRFAIYSVIAVLVTSPMTVSMRYLPPYLQYWQIFCYTVAYCVLVVNLCTFSNIFRSLFRAATLLNHSFKRDVNHKNLSAELLGKYRILWLRWSQLVSQIGCVLGKVFCVYLVLLLFATIVNFYIWLSGIRINIENMWREIVVGLISLLHTATLYYFCNYAHYFTNIVGVEIREELQLLVPSDFRDDIFREINVFLKTTDMYPPVVSVAGFANVDRGLFRAFASTIVTYMIVLVQFDQSDHSNYACCRNVTK